jgi:glycosyltransferase involved in cell wall biosynthesis
VIGTVGRVQDVKNHAGLIDAFVILLEMLPAKRAQLRLAIVGDGPLMPAIKEKITSAGIADLVWLPGSRTDIAEVLRTFSVFALSSIAEGTPGSALEAMATGLPVVATRVGGVPEVVGENVTGMLVPARDPTILAAALARYVEQPALAAQHGAAGLERVTKKYSMAAMLAGYTRMYDSLCDTKTKFREPSKTCAE